MLLLNFVRLGYSFVCMSAREKRCAKRMVSRGLFSICAHGVAENNILMLQKRQITVKSANIGVCVD